MATGIFFGAMGSAKASDVASAAEANAQKYGQSIQKIMDGVNVDLKSEGHAVRVDKGDKNIYYNLRVKITDPDTKNICIINIEKSGSSAEHTEVKLKTNVPMDELSSTHSVWCKTIYDQWTKKVLSNP